MVQRAFDERLGAGLAILLEQVLLETPGIDADADRAAVRARRGNHFLDAVLGTDVARIDAKASSAGVGGFQGALVVEVDVGDDRHVRRAHDLPQRRGAVLVGAGYADDVDARLFAAADLIDRRARIGSRRVGHRLNGHGRVSAHGDGPDHDLARLTPNDISPGADGRHDSDIGPVSARAKRANLADSR